MLTKTHRLLSVTTAFVMASSTLAFAEPSADLIAAAKKEGTLTTIALPHNWCGYGDVIAGFKAKYGLDVNELNPDAGSGDEIEAIKANKGNKGPQAPDVIDVGLSFGPTAKADGLLMPYKVSTWDSIPDTAKDADGAWYGDYYGVLSFVVNTDIVKNVPKDWDDLKKPEYANSVAFAGDPRVPTRPFRQSTQPVSPPAKGRDQGWRSRSEVLCRRQQGRQFRPRHRQVRFAGSGSTPIIVAWDYNGLAWRDSLKGNPPVEVVVPQKGVVAGVYVQAISLSPRTRTLPSSGWNTSIPTKASSHG